MLVDSDSTIETNECVVSKRQYVGCWRYVLGIDSGQRVGRMFCINTTLVRIKVCNMVQLFKSKSEPKASVNAQEAQFREGEDGRESEGYSS